MRLSKYLVLALLAFSLCSCAYMFRKIGGNYKYSPKEIQSRLSPKAKELVANAFIGLEKLEITDFHVHLVGFGHNNTGAKVHPDFLSWRHPFKRMQFYTYMSAAGIKNADKNVDEQYLQRLIDLANYFGKPLKVHLLAFDKHYNKKGEVEEKFTEFYTPNEYVFKVRDRYPQYIVPTISVHPYRKDALAELERWHSKGARFIKWLPNSMGIDPADPRVDPFYRKVKELDMVILTHAGFEAAVDGHEFQEFGNPLRLRRPLNMGVKIIVAHCASLMDSEDLDNPGGDPVDNFELFMRLMGEAKYKGLVFGEISALTQYNRLYRPLRELLQKPELHSRLVNGSDYPLPGINFLIRTSKLRKAHYITEAEEEALNEIYAVNPLLFDFVLKRTLRHPKTGGKFADSVFASPF